MKERADSECRTTAIAAQVGKAKGQTKTCPLGLSELDIERNENMAHAIAQSLAKRWTPCVWPLMEHVVCDELIKLHRMSVWNKAR